MGAFTDAIERLKNFYRAAANSTAVPGGFGKGGHRKLFDPYNADIVAIGQGCADYAGMAQGAANQAGAWLRPVMPDGSYAAVTRLSATTLAVAGPAAQLDNCKPGRAVKLAQATPGVGYVAGATYDADAGHVVVTVTGIAVEEDLSEVWLGQSPDNAPQQADTPAGADLYLSQNCNGF
ncbi:hypothetical protein DesfrDRAFT_0047 [Solidesulfovibrio fructosivorans JJ]]|uniref:Uncharacterized protein n=1 Tax=Solidesulfovibrio fructosivorans JJ] TaxID=596151 RepID=E1JQZ8_SOLFR|nr:hypothetical protein [Solidesulfovibrio fructosivorans]EFL52999.1 hypothetical protein DesfrDRAFT_0047 [Solidesulfovibrio fructosivorans JJ]]